VLIIPALYIREGECTLTPVGEDGTKGKYSCSPSAMAKLWRVENAKALHVGDLDGARAGRPVNAELVADIVRSVDIPIQVAGGIRTCDDARFMLEDVKAFRIVLSTLALDNGDALAELLERYGPRRIVAGIVCEGGHPLTQARQPCRYSTVEEFASDLRATGIQRIVYTDVSALTPGVRMPFAELAAFAERTGFMITLDGSVWNYGDLRDLQSLSPRGIDSLILGEALYANAFPCQKIWRRAEREIMEQKEQFP
jgi:phosphoribosylformimino-5-aminoimidazole carboxamide ribotide isomerase